MLISFIAIFVSIIYTLFIFYCNIYLYYIQSVHVLLQCFVFIAFTLFMFYCNICLRYISHILLQCLVSYISFIAVFVALKCTLFIYTIVIFISVIFTLFMCFIAIFVCYIYAYLSFFSLHTYFVLKCTCCFATFTLNLAPNCFEFSVDYMILYVLIYLNFCTNYIIKIIILAFLVFYSTRIYHLECKNFSQSFF